MNFPSAGQSNPESGWYQPSGYSDNTFETNTYPPHPTYVAARPTWQAQSGWQQVSVAKCIT